MLIEERIPLVDEILERWRQQLGADAQAYRNHVYRVVHFCNALHDDPEDHEKIVIAACFHDLGIWARGTFDYLAPSIALAKEYLGTRGLDRLESDVELMIDLHHRIRPHRDPLVDAFRRSDLVDVSLGIVKSGLPHDFVQRVRQTFPNAGFHRRLVQLAAGWTCRHPLRPLPVLKW